MFRQNGRFRELRTTVDNPRLDLYIVFGTEVETSVFPKSGDRAKRRPTRFPSDRRVARRGPRPTSVVLWIGRQANARTRRPRSTVSSRAFTVLGVLSPRLLRPSVCHRLGRSLSHFPFNNPCRGLFQQSVRPPDTAVPESFAGLVPVILVGSEDFFFFSSSSPLVRRRKLTVHAFADVLYLTDD